MIKIRSLPLLAFILLMPSLCWAADKPVRIFDLSGASAGDFVISSSNFGGENLSVGDVNGDGQMEVAVCSGAGESAKLTVYSLSGSQLFQSVPFGAGFTGGCYVSVGDLDGDGQAEIAVSAGFGGGPNVVMYKDFKVSKTFFAFDKAKRQGARVLLADLGADNRSEILAFSNYNAAPALAIFGNDGHLIKQQKLSLAGNGLSAAVGDFNGDGKKEIAVAGGQGGNNEVKIIGDKGEVLKTLVLPGSNGHGLNLYAADVNGDGVADLIAGQAFGTDGTLNAYDYGGTKIWSAKLAGMIGGFSCQFTQIGGKLQIVAIATMAADQKSSAYKYVAVSLGKQTLYRFQNGQLLDSYLISSGKKPNITPLGEFAIYNKRPSVDMVGPGYNLPRVPWVASFMGAYTIHGTYWHKNFGHPMSHGCINMRTDQAKLVYDWVEKGTPVIIY